jgi:hypothetical protein
VDRPALDVGVELVALVDRLPQQVEDAPEGDVADRLRAASRSSKRCGPVAVAA